MNIEARLEALATGPKPWIVKSIWSNGTRELRQPREGMARAHAERESRRIGRDLISRENGETVRLLSVSVEYAPE